MTKLILWIFLVVSSVPVFANSSAADGSNEDPKTEATSQGKCPKCERMRMSDGSWVNRPPHATKEEVDQLASLEGKPRPTGKSSDAKK